MANTEKPDMSVKIKKVQEYGLIFFDAITPKLIQFEVLTKKEKEKRFYKIFASQSEHDIEHLIDKLIDNDYFLTQLYFDLDDENQAAVIKYFDVPQPVENVYPTEKILYNSFLMFNNNSLATVCDYDKDELVYKALSKSKLDTYGSPLNWLKFYNYLLKNKSAYGLSFRQCIVNRSVFYH